MRERLRIQGVVRDENRDERGDYVVIETNERVVPAAELDKARVEAEGLERQRDYDYKRFNDAKAGLLEADKRRVEAEARLDTAKAALREIRDFDAFQGSPIAPRENPTTERMRGLADAALDGLGEPNG